MSLHSPALSGLSFPSCQLEARPGGGSRGLSPCSTWPQPRLTPDPCVASRARGRPGSCSALGPKGPLRGAHWHEPAWPRCGTGLSPWRLSPGEALALSRTHSRQAPGFSPSVCTQTCGRNPVAEPPKEPRRHLCGSCSSETTPLGFGGRSLLRPLLAPEAPEARAAQTRGAQRLSNASGCAAAPLCPGSAAFGPTPGGPASRQGRLGQLSGSTRPAYGGGW